MNPTDFAPNSPIDLHTLVRLRRAQEYRGIDIDAAHCALIEEGRRGCIAPTSCILVRRLNRILADAATLSAK